MPRTLLAALAWCAGVVLLFEGTWPPLRARGWEVLAWAPPLLGLLLALPPLRPPGRARLAGALAGALLAAALVLPLVPHRVPAGGVPLLVAAGAALVGASAVRARAGAAFVVAALPVAVGLSGSLVLGGYASCAVLATAALRPAGDAAAWCWLTATASGVVAAAALYAALPPVAAGLLVLGIAASGRRWPAGVALVGAGTVFAVVAGWPAG